MLSCKSLFDYDVTRSPRHTSTGPWVGAVSHMGLRPHACVAELIGLIAICSMYAGVLCLRSPPYTSDSGLTVSGWNDRSSGGWKVTLDPSMQEWLSYHRDTRTVEPQNPVIWWVFFEESDLVRTIRTPPTRGRYGQLEHRTYKEACP